MRKYIPNVVAGMVSIPALIYIGGTADVWPIWITLATCLVAQIFLALIAIADTKKF